jgi:hypothetical protein
MKHIIFEGPEAILHHEVGEIQPGLNLLPDQLVDRLLAIGPGGRFRAPTAAEDLPPVVIVAGPSVWRNVSEALPVPEGEVILPLNQLDHAEDAPATAPSRPRKGKE